MSKNEYSENRSIKSDKSTVGSFKKEGLEFSGKAMQQNLKGEQN